MICICRKTLSVPIAFLLLVVSCSPKITSFTAQPYTTIVQGDSVQLNWTVKGKPTLLVYEDPAGDDENPAKHYLSYKLVAEKHGKQVSYPTLSLTVLPDTSTDYIVIKTERHGDSLVANGWRDTLQWGNHFVIAGVSAVDKRDFTVEHLGKTAVLNSTNQSSAALNGEPNSGNWQIRTPLSSAEKSDTSTIPAHLTIKTIIVHKKH